MRRFFNLWHLTGFVRSATLPFEVQIRELCKQLIASESDAETIALSQELRKLIHAHIEELREAIPPISRYPLAS